MRVSDLIEKLKEFPEDALVILVEELGASELEEKNVGWERMNYVKCHSTWDHLPPTFGWEFPSEYNREIITTRDVVIIDALA